MIYVPQYRDRYQLERFEDNPGDDKGKPGQKWEREIESGKERQKAGKTFRMRERHFESGKEREKAGEKKQARKKANEENSHIYSNPFMMVIFSATLLFYLSCSIS